ncbi:MAG: hypothetical protein K6G58_10525 [Lachnospiraceae bacterium]|nr:hypothetical protein [Lachnospiraceae bacterium]
MKHLFKTVTMAVLFAAAFACPVFADTLNVSADKDSCEVGETITVTVDAEGFEGAAPPDISVEFSSARLNFEDCTAEYGGGGGGLVTFKDTKADITFTTLSGGNAEISVTASGEDSTESASVTVSVNGEDTAADSEGADLTDTGVSEGTIDAGDGRTIQTVFAEEFMPVLFHKETTDYNGQTVECAKFDMGDLSLLYTTDAQGSDGRFMIYDGTSLNEFRMIQGIENRFIIVLPDCEGGIPEGYTKAVLEWAGQTLTAFMETSVASGTAEEINGMNPSDFFLVYAMSSEGNKGWYRYDKNEGTYQRFFVTDAAAESEGEGEGESDEDQGAGFLDEYIPRNVQQILLLGLAGLTLIFIITVIILAVRLREYAEDLDAMYDGYYGDEEDEEDEGEEEDDRPAPRQHKPGAVTAASLVGRSMSDAAEDEDDEEEDEDDEEDGEDEEEDIREEAEEEEAEPEDDEEDAGEEEEAEEEEADEDIEYEKYYRSLSRKERKELEREEKWRAKEEKKAAKRRAQGYEEATPMDWSTFERDRSDAPKEKPKALPPRKKTVRPEDIEDKPKVLHEEDQRERQRRLFEQQQRIEEQRRIENERLEAERLREQQQYIASKAEDNDLDEDFQFEFLNLD